jgi:hypothetical protein
VWIYTLLPPASSDWLSGDCIAVVHEFRTKKYILKMTNGHADSHREVIFNYIFSVRTFGLGARGVHRQPQAGSTVLLPIQTGSFGDPPTPSASDLTLALDQY